MRSHSALPSPRGRRRQQQVERLERLERRRRGGAAAPARGATTEARHFEPGPTMLPAPSHSTRGAHAGARVAATRHRRRHWRHHHRRSNNVPRREEAARQAYTAASPICRTPAPTSRRLRAFPGPHRCRHQTPPPEPVPTQWAPLFLVFCRPDPLRQSLRDAPARRAPRPRRAALAAARRRHDLIPGATAKSAAGCTPLA